MKVVEVEKTRPSRRKTKKRRPHPVVDALSGIILTDVSSVGPSRLLSRHGQAMIKTVLLVQQRAPQLEPPVTRLGAANQDAGPPLLLWAEWAVPVVSGHAAYPLPSKAKFVRNGRRHRHRRTLTRQQLR